MCMICLLVEHISLSFTYTNSKLNHCSASVTVYLVWYFCVLVLGVCLLFQPIIHIADVSRVGTVHAGDEECY